MNRFLIAAAALLASAAPAHPPVPPVPPVPPAPPAPPAPPRIHPNLFVTVAPGATLHGSGRHVEFECSDNASCQFEVAPGTRIELAAWKAGGKAAQIHGCTDAAETPARCAIVIGNGRASVSAR